MAFTLKSISNTNKTIYKPKEEVKQDSVEILCQVTRFIYKDEDSGFFVFLATLADTQPNITAKVNGKNFSGRKFPVVGNSLVMVQSVVEGQEVEVWGNFEKGKEEDSVQFTAVGLQEKIPTKPKAIEIFLGSGKIYGIGPKTAKKIVNKFGADTISILDNDIELLLEVDGLNLKKLEVIKSSWKEWRAVYDIVATMKIYGVGDVAGIKIFNHFKEKAIYIIKNDPYMLTDVPTIGFKTADKIAKSIGISPTDEKRIEKCIMYTLEEISEKGHTAYPKDDLITTVNKALLIEEDLIKSKLEELIEKELLIPKNVKYKKIVDKYKNTFEIVEVPGVAHKKIHNTEVRIAKEIKRLSDFPLAQDEEFTKKEINLFLEVNKNGLDESQLDAAKNILLNKVSVLTGGPGTGKTHTIKSLLQYFDNAGKIAHYLVSEEEEEDDENGMDIVLSAPTGRAAKRMEESTGKKGSTIHRLLIFKDGQFVHNENNKLKGDVFIVDESSMIDIWLAVALLKAIPEHARIIFVGDVDQLHSVGAGNFLRDLINSLCVHVSRLSVIHRQALNSNIIVASHAIINKKLPELHDINSDSDFVFLNKEDNEDIYDSIIDIVNGLKKKGVPESDIQILTPKKESTLGTNSLNSGLRKILNKFYNLHSEMTSKFFPGDRVMQFKNNKDHDIFNGDVGKVMTVDEEGGVYSVNFDDKVLTLSGQEINELNLSYAITIHKSQGSDYPYVIIPISNSHSFMWDANLLYTAVTRGKKRVILIGSKKTLSYSVAQFKQNERITGLKDQLIELFNAEKTLKQSIKI